MKRLKSGETEEDILRMQEEYLAQKSKNPSIKPAAQFVRIKKEPKKSYFAKTRQKTAVASKTSAPAKTSTVVGQQESSKELYAEIHDKIVGATQPTSISDIVLGDIVEKPAVQPKAYPFRENLSEGAVAFPMAQRSHTRNSYKQGKSIFAQSMELDEKESSNSTAPQKPLEKSNLSEIFGKLSVIVEDENTASSVHEENLEILSQMREEDILGEQRSLRDTLDPEIIALLAKRRQAKLLSAPMNTSPSKSVDSKSLKHRSSSVEMLTGLDSLLDTAQRESNIHLPPSNAAVEILQQSAAEKWLHFDIVERDKLEWLRDVPEKATEHLKPGEQFEARFDWKGVLLPYSSGSATRILTATGKDERELYLHGEEPHRPGYTLQELFRFARSNVMQQRIAAYGALAGILNIYNQGFYDNVLDLPITKIFFLLRFGLDDNSPAMIEVISKALAYLFYNEADEKLLDFVYDNPGCHWQPTLQVTSNESESGDSTAVENLQKLMQQIHLNTGSGSAPIAARINGCDVDSRATMGDFQLAETDLMACLLRTDIIQRIYFILNNVRLDNSTVSSCLKLLIRVARSGKTDAMNIVKHEQLVHCLLDNFLPGLESVDTTLATAPFYNYPQYLCLKLIRVLVSQQFSIALKFINLNVVDKLQNYLYNHQDIKGNIIKVQIESLRILRCFLLLRLGDALYKKFLPAFRYMLDWHLYRVIYEAGGPQLIRQHAAALLAVITSSQCNAEVAATLGDTLVDCCCSWFHWAATCGVEEFSQATLLSACLNAVTWYTRYSENARERLRSFNEKYLINFILSEGFVKFVKPLMSSSIVLRDASDRGNVFRALPNSGSVLQQKLGPQLIVPQRYCVFVLRALWRLLEEQLKLCKQTNLIDVLIQPRIVEPIIEYLKALSSQANRGLATNFFAKSELRLIYSFLCCDRLTSYLQKPEILQICYNYLCCLTAEYIGEIEQLFQRIIFNSDYIQPEEAVLDKWRSTCLKFVHSHYIIVPSTELTLSMATMQTPVLPRDWPYFQLKIILQNYIGNLHQEAAVLFSEREVIHMTLTFVSLLEEQNHQLEIVTPTEKLMYLMIAFMGPESQFLESKMKALLRKHVVKFYNQCENLTFDLDGVFEGKCKFENLYALFVDHFQAASYGDEIFGSLVMVPLAQKYDSKWRRRLWSDYAAALRYLDCDESLLIGGLEAYLEPKEDDQSILKSYALALRTKSLRPNTVPYKIAKHHLTRYSNRFL